MEPQGLWGTEHIIIVSVPLESQERRQGGTEKVFKEKWLKTF